MHVLRAARERAGLSLDELAARTRIKPHFLGALERGEFERLPGDFFARAFLRTYAREIGLPPDEAMAEYKAAVSPAHPQPAAEAALLSEEPTTLSWSTTPRIGWVAAASGIALILLVLAVNQRSEPAVPEAGVPVEAGAVGTSGTVAPEAPEGSPGASSRLELALTATDQTWLAATADGKRVVYRLLQPGEHLVLEAAEGVSLRVGNAAALDYTINGRPGIPLGAPGAVRTLLLTRDNYRTFQR
jgi:cytoskeleton protein RodZ